MATPILGRSGAHSPLLNPCDTDSGEPWLHPPRLGRTGGWLGLLEMGAPDAMNYGLLKCSLVASSNYVEEQDSFLWGITHFLASLRGYHQVAHVVG